MKISARFLSIIAIPFIILTAVLAGLFWHQNKTTVHLPDYGAAPVFQLTDSSGKIFDSKNLAGKPWVASFMFTRCPDMCPLMTLKLGKLARQVQNVNYVSFTSDPDFDVPKILEEYIKRGIGPQNWIFLTGAKAEIKKITQGFMTAAPDNPGLHSTRFILVDVAGRIRGFYDSESAQQIDALVMDIRGL